MAEQPSRSATEPASPLPRLTIISGGQTGVDMAALLAAERFLSHRPSPSGHGVETGDSPPTNHSHNIKLEIAGFVPLHFTNDTGAYGIPERFRPFLTETASIESRERTERNIAQSDGILTVSLSLTAAHAGTGPARSALAVSAGTQLGVEYAASLGKSAGQMLFVDLGSASEHTANVDRTVRWVRDMSVQRCAIGGPRESEAPGIQDRAEAFLFDVFAQYLELSAQGL